MGFPFVINSLFADKDSKRHIDATLDVLPENCHQSLMDVYYVILGAESLRVANLFLLQITETLNNLPDDCIEPVLTTYGSFYRSDSADKANLFLSQVEQHHAIIARLPDYAVSIFLEKLDCLVKNKRIDLIANMTGLWAIKLDNDDIKQNAENIANKCKQIIVSDGIDYAIEYAEKLDVTFADVGVFSDDPEPRLPHPRWWQGKIKRLRDQGREHLSQILGLLKKHISQYSYNYQQQKHIDSVLMLADNVAVSPDGVAVNMLDIAKTAIRGRFSRLLNWSDGMGVYAEKHGHKCAMYTITCPSKMHPVSKNYDGTTTREAQRYLSNLWNQANARFKKRKIYPYGFRVAEPHKKDGAVHWHVLLFAPLDVLNKIDEILNDHAMRVDGEELGADKHRYKFDLIDKEKGGAKPSSYLFKYLMKGLGGRDDYTADDIDKIITEKLSTVKAWARTHGIRQVQMVGGVSVGVWNELRSIKDELEDSHLEKMRLACCDGDFCAFFELQGGHTIGKTKHYARPHRESVKTVTERIDTETGEIIEDVIEALNTYGEVIEKVVGIKTGDQVFFNHREKWSISWAKKDDLSDLGKLIVTQTKRKNTASKTLN